MEERGKKHRKNADSSVLEFIRARVLATVLKPLKAEV